MLKIFYFSLSPLAACITHNFKYPPTIRENKEINVRFSLGDFCKATSMIKARTKLHQILFQRILLTFSSGFTNPRFPPFVQSFKCMLNYLHSSASCDLFCGRTGGKNVSETSTMTLCNYFFQHFIT